MATEAQQAANSQNSQYSTGPCTHSGKDQSKRNSTTHGLSGSGKALDDSDADAVNTRYHKVCAGRAPVDALECLIIWRLSTEWIMLEKCEGCIKVQYDHARRWAMFDWPEVRQNSVRALVQDMVHDPARAIGKLRQSPQGCLALISQWDGLEGFLEKEGSWTGPHRTRAFDLLGADPLMRDSGRTELDPRPGDGTTEASRAREVIRREIKLLRARAESAEVVRADALEREDYVKQLKLLDNRESRLAERYRAEHARRLQWWWTALNEQQSPEGRERSALGAAHAVAQAEKKSTLEKAEEALRWYERKQAEQGQAKAPQWARPSAEEMAEAEQRFQELKEQHQAESTAPAVAEAPQPVGSAESSPAPAASPAPEAASAAPKSAAVPEPPTRPMTRKERRLHEKSLRDEERRRQISIQAAGNGALRH